MAITTPSTDELAKAGGAPGRAGAGRPWTAPSRRQLVHLLLFVCTPGIVLGTSVLAAASALGAFVPTSRPVAASCHQQSVDPASFQVLVLNGSGVAGRAAKAAGQLTGAGFVVAGIGTAAEGRWTDAPAVITFGPDGRGAAQLVAVRIPGAVLVSTVRSGRDVDVVLGTRFTGVSPTAGPPTLPSCAAS
jgi:hypothetical protein